MKLEVNYTKSLFWISIVFFILFICFFYIQWNNLNINVEEIKTLNNSNYQKILDKKDYGPFVIEFNKLNSKQVLIDPKEIEKINNHIKVLSEEVQKESNLVDRIMDNDIDRLNLYMSIGIGFMSLLGIFIPILVNILSVQDLREKQKEISDKFDGLDEQEAKIEEATKDSKTAITSLNSVKETTLMLSLEIKNLALQNAISRFFNVSPIVLTNAIRNQDFIDFVNLLHPIKNGFKELNSNKTHIQGNTEIQNTIGDFVLFLETEKFRNQIFNTKADNIIIDNLTVELTNLKESTIDNEEKYYKNTIEQLDQIIKIIEHKNVKNQPAA